MPLIREFYANVKEHHNESVLVHGKFVSFTTNTINAYFEIPDDLIDEYFTFELNYEEIIDYLCKGNREWKLCKGLHLFFKSNKLYGAYKCWFYFIATRLLSIKHVSNITKD